MTEPARSASALAAVRRAEDHLTDAVLDRRRMVGTCLLRALGLAVPLVMLFLGVQAAILDGLDQGPDTRAMPGGLFLVIGGTGTAIALVWLIAYADETRGSLRRRSDQVRACRRELRDARDRLDIERETRVTDVSEAEDIVARWSPPTERGAS